MADLGFGGEGTGHIEHDTAEEGCIVAEGAWSDTDLVEFLLDESIDGGARFGGLCDVGLFVLVGAEDGDWSDPFVVEDDDMRIASPWFGRDGTLFIDVG